MLCNRVLSFHRIGFGILLLVSFVVLLDLFFLDTPDTFAVSDYSIVVDDSNYNSLNVPCSSDCSSYHYLLISDMSSTTFVYQISAYSSDPAARFVITHNAGLSTNFNFLLFNFDNADRFSVIASNWSSGSSFRLTLSENNPFGSVPSGSITLTENGTFDVTNYAEAVVNVPPTVVQGDYHDDLVSINNAIYVCAAVLLVLYFFYCIYRMIIKSTGGH